MHVLVLGSAAGGGFPQWNCRCAQCDGVRRGEQNLQPRTQSSIALSVDGQRWLLVNASPDLRQQLAAHPALWPRQAPRDASIAAVLLTDAQVDHVAGLPVLREGLPMPLYCTPPVEEELRQRLPLLEVMAHWNGGYRTVAIPASATEAFVIGALPGATFQAVPLNSNAPPYSPRRDQPQAGDTIGLLVHDLASGRRLFYAPGLGEITGEVAAAMAQADYLLVDGTFWRNDEMTATGCAAGLARDMGHLPQAGPGGMLEVLADFPAARRILIHINNTNPILRDDSDERRLLDRLGIEVARDGMRFAL